MPCAAGISLRAPHYEVVDTLPALGSGDCSVMVFGENTEIRGIELPEEETDWLQRIQADFDLQSALIKLVSQNVLVDVR